MSESDERWLPIPQHKDYMISDMGRIYSHKRRPGIVKLTKKNNGYLGVSFWVGNKKKYYSVHRLVLKAFCQSCAEKTQCNHKNGIKADNRLENLEWVTQLGNAQHAKENDLLKKGEKNGNAKLKEKDVIRIRKLYISGEHLQSELGKMFNISSSMIGCIVRNENWKYIKDNIE